MSQLDSSQFLQLVTAAVALLTALLAALALTGYALWEVRETDSVAGLTLAAAGIAQAATIAVVAPAVAITSRNLLVPFGGESSVLSWLMLLPAARLAIGLSIASVIADGLVVAGIGRLTAQRGTAR